MSKKNNNYYFDMFAAMSENSCRISEKLNEILSNFNSDTLPQQMKELHSIEHAGDVQKHQLLEKLTKEFITPIECADILDLAGEIDDVTDSVEDILLKIYMYNIQSIPPKAIDFVKLVEQCCRELRNLLLEFNNFRKSKSIHDSIVELNRLEELGDDLYVDAVRSLYIEKGDPIHTVAWTEVYGCFEKCCDTCEHVANLVESVIMKNI